MVHRLPLQTFATLNYIREVRRHTSNSSMHSCCCCCRCGSSMYILRPFYQPAVILGTLTFVARLNYTTNGLCMRKALGPFYISLLLSARAFYIPYSWMLSRVNARTCYLQGKLLWRRNREERILFVLLHKFGERYENIKKTKEGQTRTKK